MDPFATLGLAPTIDLDVDELEARYLTLSRELHPDFNQGLPAAEQIAMLARSADLNVAYKTLRDDWSRAEALAEVLEPGVMDATKTLCPMFLMEAMETREAVEEGAAADWPRLRSEIQASVDEYFADVRKHLAKNDPRTAATLLHQSNYYRKALRDLIDRMHAA